MNSKKYLTGTETSESATSSSIFTEEFRGLSSWKNSLTSALKYEVYLIVINYGKAKSISRNLILGVFPLNFSFCLLRSHIKSTKSKQKE